MYNTGTNVTSACRDVASDVNKRIRYFNMTCPTSNTTSTGAGAGGTGKTDAITKLQTIPNRIEDELAFFGYRYRWVLVPATWVRRFPGTA